MATVQEEMMSIRMEHKEHGFTNVYSDLERIEHEKHGWTVQQEWAREEAAETVVIPIKRRGRPPKVNHGTR